VVDGRNPIIAHEFLGGSTEVEGKDVIIVEDMISSGDSILDVCEKLKELGAQRVFVCASFGLFTAGLARMDAAHQAGLFDRIFTGDMVYTPPELEEREWHVSVRMSKYISFLIDTLNHDQSISKLLTPADRIQRLLVSRGYRLG
jgi:ribose-phosphate pyrophosphokinase